jgi:crotonobetainyl-CoA:carnitine CoA-transferase CaiB-like acyl-CoA transferase
MESFDHQVVGEKLYPGVPFKMSVTPGYIHRPAPCLGADTEYILKNLLGVSDEQIKLLDDEGCWCKSQMGVWHLKVNFWGIHGS